MKVCKKCKKQVANKVKVCPNCGADVSKAKIIGSNKKIVVKKENKILDEKDNKKIVPLDEEKKDAITNKKEEDVVVSKEEKKDVIVKDIKPKKNKYQKMVGNAKNNKKANNGTKTLKKQKKSNSNKSIKKNDKETNINIKKSDKNNKTDVVKIIDKKTINKTKINIDKNSKKEIKNKNKKLKDKINKNQKEDSNKNKFKVFSAIKEKSDILLIKIAKHSKNKSIKKAEKAILKHKKFLSNDFEKQTKKLIRDKELLREKLLKEKELLKKEKDLKDFETRKKNGLVLEDESYKVKKIDLNPNSSLNEDDSLYNKIFNKKMLLIVCIFVMSITIVYCLFQIIGFVSSNNYIEISSDNFGSTYQMNENLEYNDLVYNITDCSIASETSYKKPRDGYQFILVNIDLQNRSDSKASYSYKNFKLKNSTGEETSRVFTPINASTALYSGSLVVGAKKTGSLVFEAPIDDSELSLNFYKEIDDIENNPLIFSIKLNTCK